jgi:DNA-binding NtrC family response regulator
MHERLPSAEPERGRLVVLVVEDEVLIRLDVSDELRRAGFDVLEAGRAEEAMDLLRARQRVDVVFSDFQLLGPLDGWDLFRSVSAAYPSAIFILTSAQTVRAEWQDGPAAFVPKPYQPRTVVDTIKRVAELRISSGDPGDE